MTGDTVTWRGGGQFAMTPRWVLTHPKLGPQEVRLYGVLALLASWDEGTLTVSQTKLADLMNVSTRTVMRSADRLVKAGALEIEPQVNERGQGWNRYLLSWDTDADPLDTAVTYPPDTVVTNPPTGLSHPSQTSDVQTRDTQSIAIRRDVAWDQLEGVFGYRAEGTEAALWGKLITKIVERGDPPEEIPRRSLIWAYHYETPLTPATLLHKWDWLGGRTAHITAGDRRQLRTMLEERASESAYWAAVNERERSNLER